MLPGPLRPFWKACQIADGSLILNVDLSPLHIGTDAAQVARGFIQKHWRGEYSLGRSFFVHLLVLPKLITSLLAVLLVVLTLVPARYFAAANLLFGVVNLAVWIWAARGTWLSATRDGLAEGSLGGLAKILVVVGAVLVVIEVVQARSAVLEQWRVALGKQIGAEFSIRVSPDATTVVFNGGMNDGAAAALEQALDRAPSVTTVSLASKGGWANEGRWIGRIISTRKLNTYVDAECRSACTLAFLAGRVRALGAHGRLAFHQVNSLATSAIGRYFTRIQTRYIYAGIGLKRDFISKIVSTPQDALWYPTTRELLDAHVITSTAEWEAARTELLPRLRARLQAYLQEQDIDVPQRAVDDLVDCEATGLTAWLNTTGCSFYYHAATKTRAEHEREQQDCVTNAGVAAKSTENDLACAKTHIPNDWAIHERRQAKAFAAVLDREHPESARAERFGTCVARKYATQLASLGCTPLALSASSLEDLLDTRACEDAHREVLERKQIGFVQTCRASIDAYQRAHTGKTRSTAMLQPRSPGP